MSARMDEEPVAPAGGPPVLLTVAMGLGVVVLVGWLLFGAVPKIPEIAEGRTHVKVGQPLPEFRLVTFDEPPREVTLADFKDKVVVLNFWGTWCGPCSLELPHLAALADRYKAAGKVVFLPVSVEAPDEDNNNLAAMRRDTLQYLDKAKLGLTPYADPRGLARQAIMPFVDSPGYPTTIVLDRQHVIRAVWSGYWPGLEEELATTVAELSQ